jgi:signal transduction histidine kinase
VSGGARDAPCSTCDSRPEVKVDIAPGMPILWSERVPPQQMFLNLIGNALKHACQGIVRQHGAQIEVDSAVGVGTTFSFSLAAGQVDKARRAPAVF